MSMRDYAVDDYGLVLNGNHLQVLAARLCDGYTEKDYDENMYDYCEELIDKLGLQYISDFTGEAMILNDDGSSEYSGSFTYFDDTVFYLALSEYPSLFHAAYSNIDEVVAEVKSSIGKYLPNNFQYRDNIRHIVGTYYG